MQKAKSDAERKLKDAERKASEQSKPACVSNPAETETQNDLRSIAETQTEVQEPEHIDHLVPDNKLTIIDFIHKLHDFEQQFKEYWRYGVRNHGYSESYPCFDDWLDQFNAYLDEQ